MTPVLHEHDPYRHLITNSQAAGSRLWGELPKLDFATEHIYSRSDPVRTWPRETPEVLERAAGEPVVLAGCWAGSGRPTTTWRWHVAPTTRPPGRPCAPVARWRSSTSYLRSAVPS